MSVHYSWASLLTVDLPKAMLDLCCWYSFCWTWNDGTFMASHWHWCAKSDYYYSLCHDCPQSTNADCWWVTISMVSIRSLQFLQLSRPPKSRNGLQKLNANLHVMHGLNYYGLKDFLPWLGLDTIEAIVTTDWTFRSLRPWQDIGLCFESWFFYHFFYDLDALYDTFSCRILIVMSNLYGHLPFFGHLRILFITDTFLRHR
jgi:hypothetical protein